MKLITAILQLGFAVLMMACATQSNEPQEQAQRKLVSEDKATSECDTAACRNIMVMQQNAYEESGIPAFMKNGEEKTMADMDKFYNDVIIGKYAGHPSQRYLKGKFIHYEINYFDFLHTERPQEQKLLVSLTRELMAAKYGDVGFVYDCLAACRGKMETKEYNSLVDQAKQQLLSFLEQTKQLTPTSDETSTSKGKARQQAILAGTIKSLEQSMADLEALTIN